MGLGFRVGGLGFGVWGLHFGLVHGWFPGPSAPLLRLIHPRNVSNKTLSPKPSILNPKPYFMWFTVGHESFYPQSGPDNPPAIRLNFWSETVGVPSIGLGFRLKGLRV